MGQRGAAAHLAGVGRRFEDAPLRPGQRTQQERGRERNPGPGQVLQDELVGPAERLLFSAGVERGRCQFPELGRVHAISPEDGAGGVLRELHRVGIVDVMRR